MPLRLSSEVVCGEINNTSKNAVYGWLWLRHREDPIRLHLSGNCAEDLAGSRFRFTSQLDRFDYPAEEDLSELAKEQIGPAGTITYAKRVKAPDCDSARYKQRATTGAPPPTEWKPCLYLEWFSQNGRVVIELVNPELEFLSEDDETSHYPPNVEGIDLYFGQPSQDGDQEAEQAEAEDWSEEPDADDPYGLFPTDLQSHIDESVDFSQTAFSSSDEADPSTQEMELMDSLIESGGETPLHMLFDPPLKIPHPDTLTQNQAQRSLTIVLARLARFGIALDICEHFSPLESYRLLIERIFPEEGVYPQLKGTQWVQHFMTHDFCEQCDAEMEEELRNSDDEDQSEN